jgi:excisionase family DNA binding protein
MERRPTIMTVKEVAKYLRMHEASVYRMCKKGLLPAYKIGKSWRFRKEEIEKWLAERKSNNNQQEMAM